jgi:hypothetical protein
VGGAKPSLVDAGFIGATLGARPMELARAYGRFAVDASGPRLALQQTSTEVGLRVRRAPFGVF